MISCRQQLESQYLLRLGNKLMKKPVVSIIVPTYYQSKEVVAVTLKSIFNQQFPKGYYEVIIADNNGGEEIRILSKQYGATIIEVSGDPPQVCKQVNLGAKSAKGEYIFVLDHDIELSLNFLRKTISLIEDRRDIDAWYIPYKIVAKGGLLNKIRNFEEYFYKDSIIAAARIIRKSIFWKTKDQYDIKLSSGPADWDLTNQLKVIGAKFGYTENYVYHHEEQLNLFHFLSKKTIYANGGEIYKKKWLKENEKIYNEIVKKQYDPLYRLFWIFIENGKWKKLILNIHLYVLFLIIKVAMAGIYLYNLKKMNLNLFKNP